MCTSSPAFATLENRVMFIGFHKMGNQGIAEQDPIVVHGGDGSMLHALRTQGRLGRPFYGVHHGAPHSVGFLMNAPLTGKKSLEDRIKSAKDTAIHPLCLTWHDKTHYAINEVTLLRASPQAIRLRIALNDQVVLDGLYGDGLIVSTPTGSTAYNRSAGGPIIPIGTPLIALTPVCPITPWRGALVHQTDIIHISIIDGTKRPVAICVDGEQVGVWRDDEVMTIQHDAETTYHLLFDPEHHLEARIRACQFQICP